MITARQQVVAGSGLTKTGALLAVGANADGSIIANADDIQVGVLATDAQHGNRGGASLHALVVASGAAGFMSGSDKAKLDSLSPYLPDNVTIGAFGSTPNAFGLTLVDQVLNLEAADGTHPGALSTTTQDFAGAKRFLGELRTTQGQKLTFDGTVGAKYLLSDGTNLTLTGLNFTAPNFSGSSSGSNSGDLTIGTASGLSLSGQVLSLALAVAGGASGALSGSDKTKLNSTTGTNSGDLSLGTPNGLGLSGQILSMGLAVANGANGALLGTDKTKLDATTGTNSGDLSLGTANGVGLAGQILSLSTAVANGASGALLGTDKAKLDATTGTNSGDLTIGTANGLSLSGQALSLTLAVAGGANGALSGTDKTKLNSTSGTNSGDLTLGAFGSTPSSTGASLASQVLTLQPADGSNPGLLSTAAQTVAGLKTFSGGIASTPSASTVGLQITGAASATAPLVQLTDSSGTNFLTIANTGIGQIGSISFTPTYTTTSHAQAALWQPVFAPASNSSGFNTGFKIEAIYGKLDGSSTVSFATGGVFVCGLLAQMDRLTSGNIGFGIGTRAGYINLNKNGTVDKAVGLYANIENDGDGTTAGTITNAYAINAALLNNSVATGNGITKYAALQIDTPMTGVVVATAYGVYIDNLKTASVTTAYGVFQVGSTVLNQFAGRVDSTVASGSSAFTILQGAKVNFDGTGGAKTLSSDGTTATFTGLNLAASNLSGTNTGDTPLQVLDEGISLTSTATSLNFVGAGVTATHSGNAITVTIATTGFSGTTGAMPYFDSSSTVASTGITWDPTHSRMGVNNLTPAQALDVTGSIQFSLALMPNGTAGTSGQVLTSAGAGAVPTWTTLSSGGTLTGSAGKVAYWDGSTSLNNSGNFLWNNASSILTVTGNIIGTVNVQTPILADTGGATRHGITAAAGNTYKDAIASPGAASVAHLFDTSVAYPTTGGLLVKVSNNGTLEASVDLNGTIVCGQGATAGSGTSLKLKSNTAFDGGNCTSFSTMLKNQSSDAWRSDATWTIGTLNIGANSITGSSSLPSTYKNNYAASTNRISHQFQSLAWTDAASIILSVANGNATNVVGWNVSGKAMYPTSGTANVVGQAQLASGTVTVSTTAVKTGDFIKVWHAGTGTSATFGHVYPGTITDATSFVINSTSLTDNDKVTWEIFRQG